MLRPWWLASKTPNCRIRPNDSSERQPFVIGSCRVQGAISSDLTM